MADTTATGRYKRGIALAATGWVLALALALVIKDFDVSAALTSPLAIGITTMALATVVAGSKKISEARSTE